MKFNYSFLRVYIIIAICFLGENALPQKVGVVLSGGGAAGVSHVGFLKVLEENNIPIDYITGTSMGSVVAAMYASGYTPDQMHEILTSDRFQQIATGFYQDKNSFYFKQDDPDASFFNFDMSVKGEVNGLIPTNFVSPVALDYFMLSFFSQAEAAANYDFDSLMIPFRCVASDVYNKKSVLFRKGNLTEATRASATYPFYITPIKVDGNLLFDGGIYNNFPSDIMYEDFFPDIIIGNNVGFVASPPEDNDLISQLQAMVVIPTEYTAICENGVVVSPDMSDIGTFGFTKVKESYERGYNATKDTIATILQLIERRVTDEEIATKRKAFQAKFKPLIFDDIEITGLKKQQKKYVERSLIPRKKIVTFDVMKDRYFKVFSDDKIKSIYPKTRYDDTTGAFDVLLDIRREEDLKIGIGGVFASKPVTTGLITAKYNFLSFFSSSIAAKYYFGRFYNSLTLKGRFDIPSVVPFFVEPEFTNNKYDYFRSQNTFFTEDRPSYFVSSEVFGRLSFGIPISNKGKIKLGWTYGKLEDEYYQNRFFSKGDTSDLTKIYFNSPYIKYERSTLVDKMYPNSGTYTLLEASAVSAEERHLPGSTSLTDTYFSAQHDWLQLHFSYLNYYKRKGMLRLGFVGEAYYSTQPLYNNYFASIARARSFKPTTESNYLFLESFRANQFLSAGQQVLINMTKNLELRLEGYVFQPYRQILRQEDNTAAYGKAWEKRFIVGSANVVIRTPIGPIGIGGNYYHNLPEVSDESRTPVTFFFHFGYALFNNRALH